MEAFVNDLASRSWIVVSPQKVDERQEKDKINVTLKIFDLTNYPNGDNRIFTMHG